MGEVKTLAYLRKENGLSQKELAVLLGVSAGTIGMWETGHRTPPLKKAIEVANLFNTQVECISFPTYPNIKKN